MKGERGKIVTNKLTVFETLRILGMDILQLLVSVMNLQDEKMALQYQVIQLQAQNNINSNNALNVNGSPATNIITGRSPPLPHIPNSLRHAPSERFLIFKADSGGVPQTKAQQEQFRSDINELIGEELMEDVDVIRPTRNGGHTVIFQSEQVRDKILEVLRDIENEANISEDKSCIIVLKKKYARVVCRDPPEDTTREAVLETMYGRNNPHLCQIPSRSRIAKIIDTRFGWIFEMNSLEAVAVQAQGGRIRFRHARELRVEEYISLQQCYKYCAFGHSIKNCLSKTEYCRLCGEIGYMG